MHSWRERVVYASLSIQLSWSFQRSVGTHTTTFYELDSVDERRKENARVLIPSHMT